VRTLRDPKFDQNDLWNRFRGLLLQYVGAENNPTPDQWVAAEALWQDLVHDLATKMPESKAERVAVTRGTLIILEQIEALQQGWTVDPETGKLRPPR
jgi:hypothetical protein